MRKLGQAGLICALGLLGACEVNVDENTARAAENGLESLGNNLEEAAGDTINTAGQIGDVVENQAQALDNNVDIDVNTDAGGDAATNNQ